MFWLFHLEAIYSELTVCSRHVFSLFLVLQQTFSPARAFLPYIPFIFRAFERCNFMQQRARAHLMTETDPLWNGLKIS